MAKIETLDRQIEEYLNKLSDLYKTRNEILYGEKQVCDNEETDTEECNDGNWHNVYLKPYRHYKPYPYLESKNNDRLIARGTKVKILGCRNSEIHKHMIGKIGVVEESWFSGFINDYRYVVTVKSDNYIDWAQFDSDEIEIIKTQ